MLTYRLGLTFVSSLFLAQSIVQAQVITDGTAGEGVTLEGPDFDIGAELGTQAGGNLFHSFEQFSIDTGESATFSGPGSIDNIISRVTGGEISAIDGLIASTIPGASLWLFNPSGVVFGPNASLDVTGSFHVSTADELRTADGGVYSAVDPEANGFSVAEPEAFGFLGADPAGITIAGSQLAVGEGETLSVVGGDIDIAGAALATGAGELNVLAASGPAEANVVAGEITGAAGGEIAVREASSLVSTGDGGGRIRIEGGAFVLDGGSAISSSNTGASDGEVGIDVNAETAEITGGSIIQTTALDEGDGGSVILEADDIDLADATRIASSATGNGNGGDITLRGDDIDIRNGAAVASSTSNAGAGGTIDIDTGDVTLTEGLLVALTEETASGDGGDIDIEAESAELGVSDPSQGSLISAVTFGSGQGGDIDIRGGRLLADGSNVIGGATISSLSDSTTGGASGQVRIDVEDLTLVGSGSIFGDASGSSTASTSIDITANDINIDGTGEGLTAISIAASSVGDTAGAIVVRGDDIDIRNGGLITTTTANDLDASDILIVADRISLSGQGRDFGAQINSNASADASGNAGNITIVAEIVNLSGDGTISSSTLGSGDAGIIDIAASDSLRLSDDGEIETTAFRGSDADAGSILIRTSDLTLLDSGNISSSTFGIGNAGSIDINANTALLDANRAETFGGIITQGSPGSTGDAGTITLEIDDLVLRDEAAIASDAFGTGDAGTISILSDTITIDASETNRVFITGISTAADVDAGDAGAIAIAADRLTLLGDSADITSSNDGLGSAGIIDLQIAESLILDSGADIRTASASGGGGSITINAGSFIASTGPEGEISTTVADDTGNAGDIVIDTPVLALGDTSVLAQADAGTGGDIQIAVDDLVLSPDAVINAEAGATGVDGTVAVSSPEVDLTSGIVAFDGSFLDIASLLRERCAARRASDSSSFTLGAGGSIPADLDAPRLSLLQARQKETLPDQKTVLVIPCPKAAS